MKPLLMNESRDFDLTAPLPWNAEAFVQDLGLDALFEAMAGGDAFLLEVARKAVLLSAPDVDTIEYRQAILKDCLNNRSIIKDMYRISVGAIEGEGSVRFGILGRYPGYVLARAIKLMEIFVDFLRQLRDIADEKPSTFESEGFQKFFAMLRTELGADFFGEVKEHLKYMKFRDGVLMSAELGKGLKGSAYLIRKSEKEEPGPIRQLIAWRDDHAHTVHIHPRDEAGARCLSELRDRGINVVANALGRSADHILGFFSMLRTELAFYLACMNVYDAFQMKGRPICFPVAAAPGEHRYSCSRLVDAGLALRLDGPVVGNDLRGDNTRLVIITGANQGGKSTFLRSVGLAQIMMQCGMFVPAAALRASVCDGLFTHFKREEDSTMKSGKFDEELARMSEIIDHITPNAMLLFNESFAATNEIEGSEIARQIIRALVDENKRVFFVTHLYDFAHSFYAQRSRGALFLRADRESDGARTFKLIEGEPLATSYGRDVYERVWTS